MDLQIRATRLATALSNGYGNVLTAAAQLARLVQAGAGMVAAATNVPNAIVSLGAGAVFCAGVAAAQTTQAVAKVNVSVEVSVMVTGSIG